MANYSEGLNCARETWDQKPGGRRQSEQGQELTQVAISFNLPSDPLQVGRYARGSANSIIPQLTHAMFTAPTDGSELCFHTEGRAHCTKGARGR